MQKEEILNTLNMNRKEVAHWKQSFISQVESIQPETFLIGAALSVGASFLLRVFGRQSDAQFVGQWAPTLLLVGLYAKKASAMSDVSTCSGAVEGSQEKEMH